MKNKISEIDLVYLWVNGNDPKWLKKRNNFLGIIAENAEETCKARFVDSDELKYSLRSVEKYAPWVRKIFIVTDNQTPDWLDTENPKVKIIDHVEILPAESLPCYNSALIEHFLYKIPELSECFLYANDDMFLNKAVSPDIFFADDGFPIIRQNRKFFRKLRWFWQEDICKKPLNNYTKTIKSTAQLVEKKFDVFYAGMPHHNIDAYRKSDCKRVVEEIFNSEISKTFTNHTRKNTDVQRVVYSYVALAEKRGHLHYTSKNKSLQINIHKANHYEKLKKHNPIFFCMNDSQRAQDSDRERSKEFLNSLFPEKSTFEI